MYQVFSCLIDLSINETLYWLDENNTGQKISYNSLNILLLDDYPGQMYNKPLDYYEISMTDSNYVPFQEDNEVLLCGLNGLNKMSQIV